MFELLVPPTKEQLDELGGDKKAYDLDAAAAADGRGDHRSCRTSAIEADVWKIEGLERREDCAKIVAAARRGGRDKVGCIVLGRGEDDRKVHEWLATAAAVPGFIGFAVGRTDFWEPLVDWRAKKITREAAVAEIARRYRRIHARSSTRRSRDRAPTRCSSRIASSNDRASFVTWPDTPPAANQTKEETSMQLGMIGLGRMGANMVRRLIRDGHECVGLRHVAEGRGGPREEKARPASTSLADFVEKLDEAARDLADGAGGGRRQDASRDLLPLLDAGDILIDGGNSYYVDDIRRAKELAPKGIHYVDVGTSGGVWGLERGYCMMIGGEDDVVKHLDPIFATLAPGIGDRRPHARAARRSAAPPSRAICTAARTAPATSSRWSTTASSTASWPRTPRAWASCSTPTSASRRTRSTPRPRRCAIPSTTSTTSTCADIAEVWRRGSVIASWLLDLTAASLIEDPALANFAGRVSDSGEGRWTIKAAIDEAVPAPVLTTALYERFSSRGEADFQDKLLSAMRFQFGGHLEKAPASSSIARERRWTAAHIRTRWSSSAPRAISPTRRSSRRCRRW